MPNKKTILTKTCSVCGMQKPLSAFLIASSTLGGKYGDICATCRRKQKEKDNALQEPEEGTSSSSGFKIDQKAKVKSEQDKREIISAKEELYHEERADDEIEKLKQIEKTEKIAIREKEHRERKQKVDRVEEKTEKRVPGQPDSPIEVGEKEKQINPNAPFIDTYIAGKLKFGIGYDAFSRWAKASAIGQAREKTEKKAPVEKAENANTQIEKAEKTSPKKVEDTPKDLPDYVKKKFGA